MTEANRGPLPRDISPAFIAAARDSVFDAITEEGLSELRRFSRFSERRGSLSPGSPEFEGMPSQTQNLIRRSTSAVILKPMRSSIVPTLALGVFDAAALYRETSALLDGTSARNPFPKPEEPTTQISIAEWTEMVRIAAEDPTHIRLFNKGFPYLPHSMRAYFRRLGTFLFFIHDELIPEAASKMEKEGVPRTYGKRAFKKVEIAAEHPFGLEEHLRRAAERHQKPKIRKTSRRRRRSIWSYH